VGRPLYPCNHFMSPPPPPPPRHAANEAMLAERRAERWAQAFRSSKKKKYFLYIYIYIYIYICIDYIHCPTNEGKKLTTERNDYYSVLNVYFVKWRFSVSSLLKFHVINLVSFYNFKNLPSPRAGAASAKVHALIESPVIAVHGEQ